MTSSLPHLPHLQLRAKDAFRSFGFKPSLCSVIPLLVKKPHRAHSTARTSLKLQHSAHNTETWRQSNLCTKITAGPEDAVSPSAAPAFCSSAQILGNSRMTPQCCDNCWLDRIFITQCPKYIHFGNLEASSEAGKVTFTAWEVPSASSPPCYRSS